MTIEQDLTVNGGLGLDGVGVAFPLRVGSNSAGVTGVIRIVTGGSGNVDLSAGASGSWTMKLPTGAGTSGQQLQTSVSGSTATTSWAAASSLRDDKQQITRVTHASVDAMGLLKAVPVYTFRYKPEKGTLDQNTLYIGVMADEAPWAMHHGGQIFNPVSAFGYTVLAFQTLEQRVAALEAANGLR